MVSRRRYSVLRALKGGGVALLLLSGCSHFETITPVDARAHDVVGHSVRVWTVDGEKLEFHVHRVTEEGIYGPARRIPFERIAKLERREFGLWETAAFLGLAFVSVFGSLLWRFYGP